MMVAMVDGNILRTTLADCLASYDKELRKERKGRRTFTIERQGINGRLYNKRLGVSSGT